MYSLNSIVEAEYAKLCFFTETPSSDDFEKLYPTALSQKNIEKNRYSNILPSETTRVRLSSESGDYINANFIRLHVDGLSEEYICCQAPLENTVEDFWTMVWEMDVPIVCSLNRLVENGRVKGDIYWPEMNESGEWDELAFSDLTVTMVSYDELEEIETIFRMIEIYDKKSKSSRRVLHIHYLGWSDFGVPGTTSHIRSIIKIIENWKHHGREIIGSGPVIVHCSAGVGRTGTFVAIALILKSHRLKIEGMEGEKLIEQYKSWDVLNIVLSLRKQRNFAMVQTLEQYGFIYRALGDELVNSNENEDLTFCPFSDHISIMSTICQLECNHTETIVEVTIEKRRRIDNIYDELKIMMPSTKKLKLSIEDSLDSESTE